MRMSRRVTATAMALLSVTALPSVLAAQTMAPADAARERDADAWAAKIEAQLTDDERIALVHGIMPLPIAGLVSDADRAAWPKDVIVGAGYVHGVPRLGVPSLRETDASLGVTNPGELRPHDTATALPAGLALGATFNPSLAYAGGKAVGEEARAKGFNVLLGGGVNLARDPRNGRNFEYISEDPLLSGMVAGAAIAGTQSAGVVSTTKHYAINSYETNRHTSDSQIDEAAARESDLLAFEIAIEQGRPGSVMCAYNLVNGAKSCGNDWLLNTVLKRDWGYKGWVMSDWGAVDAADYAMKGLDQQSGEQLDKKPWFAAQFKAMLADGSLSRARLADMDRRILRSMKAAGIVSQPAAPAPDMAAHAAAALEVARQGIVLLKNDGALPLVAGAKRIAVIGGNASTGVLSGGGSSQGLPPKGWAASVPVGGAGLMALFRIERWFPGAPTDALKTLLPGTQIDFDPGFYPADAAAAARGADVAIVFVSKHELEGFDSPDLSLPRGQDAIVAAAAAANPNTIVVMETGNPVAMPWRDSVKAIVAAWYPGQEGGQAIAEVLTGKVNPSGRLPITFPASVEQLPRPVLPGYYTPEGTAVAVPLNEGADVGYRWFAKRNLKPLYAFGHGLSYTSFAYSNLTVTGGRTITATLTVRNTGRAAGADVPQLYLQARDGAPMQRLLGFTRVELQPGESRTVTMTADPRLLADWNTSAHGWQVKPGRYAVALARAADAPVETRTVAVQGATLKP